MNDQLQQALLSVLQSTVDAATAAKNFLVAEVPDVIHQLLVWKAVRAGTLAAVWLVVLVLVITLSVKLWCASKAYKPRNAYDGDAGYLLAASVAAAVVAILPCVMVVNQLMTLLQILVAPKIYLIEYAAQLARSLK